MKVSEVKEVWVLEITEADPAHPRHSCAGNIVLAEDASAGNDFLAYASLEDAIKGARHQSDTYGIDSAPVRLN